MKGETTKAPLAGSRFGFVGGTNMRRFYSNVKKKETSSIRQLRYFHAYVYLAHGCAL
jgi:hypothetical protein